MSIKSRLIAFIQRQMEANGLQIVRTPFPDDHPFSLLELLSDRLPRNGADFLWSRSGPMTAVPGTRSAS